VTQRQQLAARRRLLAANATLQRLRLAHDVLALRQACRPVQWLPSAVRLLRGLALWRAARALRRR
jgi:hypothetical protein